MPLIGRRPLMRAAMVGGRDATEAAGGQTLAGPAVIRKTWSRPERLQDDTGVG
jgi:hypothetical protein